MKEIRSLRDKLKTFFPWHQSRLDFLAKFIVAVIQTRTVNLTQIAQAFAGGAKIDSSYKRLQRFFRGFDLDLDLLAKIALDLIPFDEHWLLSMDRTNWRFGKININILFLAVSWNHTAIPLLWVFLPKKGNSNTGERILLMERFLALFGSEKISCLTADREFVGKEWIGYLQRKRIRFRIRVRANTRIQASKGNKSLSASVCFGSLSPGEFMILSGKREVWGLRVWVVGLRLEDDYLILITDHCPQTALSDYKRRWEIETLFGCLKTRGFRFEDTHITHYDRLSKLLALVVIAFCWAVKTGVWLHQAKEIVVKKHGRKAKGFFRYGFEHLRNIFFNLSFRTLEFSRVLKLLSCT